MSKSFLYRIGALFVVVAMLGIAACGGNTPDISPSETAQTEEEIKDAKTEYELYQKAFVAPQEYAATLVVTINPEVRLYLNEQNEILAVEYLNQDAMEAYGDLKLEGQSCDAVVEQMVQAAIEQNYLKEGKDVTVKVEEVVSDAISPSDINAKLEVTVNKVITSNDMTANVSFLVDEKITQEASSETQPVQEEPVATTCSACNGTGNSCQECSGTGIVNCKRCNNGVESCGTCHGTAVITCHGCHGSKTVGDMGEICNYCGGSGTMSCDACGGQGTFLCSWCKGELRHVCPECWGEGGCDTCGGDGVL